LSVRAQRIIVLVGLLVAALALSVPAAPAGVSQTIHAYFDADGHLMFTYVDGSSVGSTIPPGTYQVTYDNFGADDLADDHAFHLSGPGIDFAPPATVVQSTFNVTFQANGTYTLQDDLHPTIGRRLFVATGAGGSDAPGTTTTGGASSGSSSGTKSSTKPVSSDIVGSAITPFRGTLAGAISQAGRLSLSFKGKTVSSLKSGRYKIAVVDQAATTAFEVEHGKKQPLTLTGIGFVGKHTTTVMLDAGQWWFFSGSGKKTYFVVVG
jgi:hypothetical protein